MATREIPSISNKVGQSVFQRFDKAPIAAIRETASLMRGQNSTFLDFCIRNSLSLMPAFGEEAARWYLTGAAYFYQCYADEAEQLGIPVMKASPAVADEITRGKTDFLGIFHRANPVDREKIEQDILNQERRFSRALQRQNPVLSDALMVFLNKGEHHGRPPSTVIQFKEGAFDFYKVFLVQSARAEKEQAEEVKPASSFVIPISKAAIQTTLVEIILNRQLFVSSTLDKIKGEGVLLDIINKAADSNPGYAQYYHLFASLVCASLLDECSRKEIAFPIVSEETATNIIVDMGRSIDGKDHLEISRVAIAKYQSVLNMMSVENTYLLEAYDWLIEGYGIALGSDRFMAAFFATTYIYHHLRNQQWVDYLRNNLDLGATT